MRRFLWLVILFVFTSGAYAQIQTVTSLSAPSSAVYGQAVTLTASVSPQGASGKVTFFDGVSILGSATLSNGIASLTTTAIGDGNRSLGVVYGGDGNYTASRAPAVTENVTTKPGGGLTPAQSTNVTAFQSQPAALFDLNHDGNLDLIVTGSNGNSAGPATLWVLAGHGDGTFAPAQAYLPATSSYSVAVADINMDGNADLIVGGPNGIAILIGNGDGTFKAATGISSANPVTLVRAADFNGDGHPDLICLTGSPFPGSPSTAEIFFGNGDGGFQTGSPVVFKFASTAFDILVTDLNSDGIPDLAMASGDSITVLIGGFGGVFAAPVSYTSYNVRSLAAGDLNGDGKIDIVAGSNGLPLFDLLLGNGDGTLAAAHTIQTKAGPPQIVGSTDAGSLSISVHDFDGDGRADVVSAEGTFGFSVMRGNGDGTFRVPLVYPIGSTGALVVGDLNHDGIADIVTSPVQPYLGSLAPEFTLTASPNPVSAGQDLTIAVAASYADATGTISVTGLPSEGIYVVPKTATLSNGMASVTSANIPRGHYYIGGTYGGDARYSATVLPGLYVAVQQPVGITLSASPNPALAGQVVTLTATVSMNVGNATVAFFDGAAPLSEQTLYSTTATYKTILSAGTHQLTAFFPEYQGLIPTSATVTEVVQATPNGTLVGGPSYTTYSTPGQVLAGDFDGNGFMDLAVLDTGAKAVTVFLGTGTGSFQSPRRTPLAFVPGAMTAAQFDIYGHTDLAVTDPADNAIAILDYYNDGFFIAGGSAAIASIAVGQQPAAIATADFNGDGFADLVTANAGSNDVSVLNTLGAPGWFQHPVSVPGGRHPDALVTGDFNLDGRADFAIANRDDDSVTVFAGNGDGTFQAPIVTVLGGGPTGMAGGDLNGDGKVDLAIIQGGSNQLTILLGNGDGTFTTSAQYAAGTAPSSVTMADLDGDGKLDLAVTAASGLLIFTGNGDGTFSGPVSFSQYAGAASVAAGAFSIGRMDLAVSLPGGNSVTLVVNGTPTSTSLSANPPGGFMGTNVVLTAAVSPPGAVGAVSFFDGVTQIGAAPVSQGAASFSTTLLLPGPHSLTARFAGESGYGTSTSNAISMPISPVQATGLAGPLRQTFSYNPPMNLIPGDFDKDGKEDLAFWRSGNGLVVTLGNGDGTFHYPPAGTSQGFGGPSPVTADFNNDGNIDIGYAFSDFDLGDGKGGFRSFVEQFNFSASLNASALAVADFNGDGRVDVVFANPAGTADVLAGIGNGTFQVARSFPAGTNPKLVATADFNEDGKPDILIVNSNPSAPGSPASGALNVLNGDGNTAFGTARQIAIAGQPMALALADYNGDGHLDVAVAHSGTNQVSVLLGGGDGTFATAKTLALSGAPAQLLAADMDGDGKPDLVVMFSTATPAFAVFPGNGDGTFGPAVNYPDLSAPSAIAVGDVTGDGRLDVILAEGDTINVFPGALGALAIAQGSSQTVAVGTTYLIPLAVTAPPGTQVTFAAPLVNSSSPAPGGSFTGGATAVTVTADGSGVATAPLFTANGKPGNFSVIASARDVAGILSFSLTSTPGPPASLKPVAGLFQSAFINNRFPSPFVVAVLDSFGNGVAGVSVTFMAPSLGPSGTFTGGGTSSIQVTGVQGSAGSPLFTANGIIGTYNVTVSVSGLTSASFPVTNQPPPAITVVSGANQSAILNASFSAPVIAKVADSSGKPVAFTEVIFTAPSSGASAMFAFSGSNTLTTFTGPTGMVSSGKFSAASATGSYTVVATLPAYGTSTTFTLTNTPNPPGQPQPQSISFPPIAQHIVTDPPFALSASASSGLPVTFTVTAGPASLSGSTLTITGTGSVTVQASQAGNATYLPADPVTHLFVVTPPPIVIQAVANAASYARTNAAPDEIVSILGSGFSTQTILGSVSPSLAGVSATFRDSTGKSAPAGLFFVSPSQLNLVVPEGMAPGPGAVFVAKGSTQSSLFPINVVALAPGIFTADASGTGPPAALASMLAADGTVQYYPVFQCSGTPTQCTTLPIDVSAPGSRVYLTLYGTGLRGNADLSQVSATIGGTPVSVSYSGAQPTYPGLDQVNLELPPSLAGQGQLVLQLSVQGVEANPVKVAFQ